MPDTQLEDPPVNVSVRNATECPAQEDTHDAESNPHCGSLPGGKSGGIMNPSNPNCCQATTATSPPRLSENAAKSEYYSMAVWIIFGLVTACLMCASAFVTNREWSDMLAAVAVLTGMIVIVAFSVWIKLTDKSRSRLLRVIEQIRKDVAYEPNAGRH